MPPAGPQNRPNRPIGRHGIFNRFHRGKRVAPIRANGHQPVERERILRVVLAGIKAVRRGLPNVDFGVRDRSAIGIADHPFRK